MDVNQIAPVIKLNSGCDAHRIIWPLKYMGFLFNMYRIRPPEDSLANCKILFFNRSPDIPMIKAIHAKQKYGFKIVCDLDDFWELNALHVMDYGWKQIGMADKIVLAIRNSDAVIVTTERLADRVKPLNPNVHIIPNALPFEEEQFKVNPKEPSEEIRFIFAGGGSHSRDCRLLAPVIKEIARAKTKAKFIMAGYDVENKTNHAVWDKMENVFNPVGYNVNYQRRNTLPLDSYMNHYDHGDVSLVPLESNYFTSFKSNLKIIEAGCKKMPIIVSDTPPYSDEPFKDAIMYAKNVKEWVKHIKYCCDNPNFVTDQGEKLGEYVRQKYDLKKINNLRIQLFDKLIS